jgi:uncharacterized protein YraI
VHKHLSLILFILCTACSFEVHQIGAETPTAFVITGTLPPSLTPKPTDTPLPPPPSPTIAPVEGTTSTQINVRSAPSTVSNVLGILPANTKVQIVGKDPGESWWQIIYEQGNEGKGWVTAQYVKTTSKPEVPIIGGGNSNPENAKSGVIQQKLNIRSGPGVSFNSIGTLNAQDIVNLTGKDANGAWLQIEFAAGPDGKGWVNAAFVQAKDVANLPIIGDSGQVVGTGTPVDTPPPPSPTVAPAPDDHDSAQAPAVNVTFSAGGTHSMQFSSDVSAPNGDKDDWLQFTPYTNTVTLKLDCNSNSQITLELLRNNQPVPSWKTPRCGERIAIAVDPGTAYLIHVQAMSSSSFNYSQYMISITSIP